MEPTTELVATAIALAPIASFWSTPKKSVKIGTRNTPPPSPNIEPRMAVIDAAIPSSIASDTSKPPNLSYGIANPLILADLTSHQEMVETPAWST